MSESELQVKIGDVEFSGRGDADWLSKQLEKVMSSAQTQPPIRKPKHKDEEADLDEPTDFTLGPNAKRWIAREKISDAHLSSMFHQEEGAFSVIAGDVPGGSSKVKTINCYLLEGARSLLESDQPKFEDKAARELCKSMGCYDGSNHATSIGDVGNKLAGNKNAGYTLSAPGLKAAAELLKSSSQ